MVDERPDMPVANDMTAHRRLIRADNTARAVLFIVVLTTLVVYGLSHMTLLVFPILVAFILATAISPFVGWLKRRSWSPTRATVLAFVVLMIVFSSVMVAIIAATRAQWDQLSDQATQRLDEFSSWLQHGPFQVNSATLENFSSSIENFLTTRDAGGTAVEGLMALSQVLAGFVLMAVIVFFFLKDGRSMWRFFLHRLRGKQLAKARLTGIRAVEILGGYVRGTAIVALVDAVLIGASLLILQVPLALPLTVVIFVGAFVPVLGATVTGVLAALVALVGAGLLEGLIVAVVIVVVNQLEGQLLQPIVMGRTLHIHPLVVLMALTGGAVVGGIMGAILAVPLTAVGWAALKIWVPPANSGTSQPVCN